MSSAPADHAVQPVPRHDRAALLRLGETGGSWDFLSAVSGAFAHEPDDPDLRALAAAHSIRLGLPTLALEHLDRLAPTLADDPTVLQLRAAATRLPPDVRKPAHLLAVAQTNVRALLVRGCDLRDAYARWESECQHAAVLVARDGNVLTRDARSSDGWEGVTDAKSAAARLVASATPTAPTRMEDISPLYISGLNPPWTIRSAHHATASGLSDHKPLITVVHRDESSAMLGLSLADLRTEIGDARTAWFIGPAAYERFAEHIRGRFACVIDGPVLGPSSEDSDRIASALRTSCDQQHREIDRLAAEIRLSRRDLASWASRWSRIVNRTSDSDRPRVLIPTCRYTTFVRHSAEDLVDAFEHEGWDARLLIEPDEWSRLSTLAYLRAFAEHRPDLVVLINYPRRLMGQAVPEDVPYVCWVQDDMPHLLDPVTGAAQTALDFSAGLVRDELFDRAGWPRQQSRRMPVPVSPAKFHAGTVAPELLAMHRCEIAYVGHQSETPDAFHARMARENRSRPEIVRAMESLMPRVAQIASGAMRELPHTRLHAAVAEALRASLGVDAPADAVNTMASRYAVPLADRCFRHESLAWAVEAATRNDWRVHIYGRGWDKHPTFSRFARGEVEHGEPLRAVYQAASVHLHASINTLMHQRVFECAMSGGLPVARLHLDDLLRIEQTVAAAMLQAPARPTETVWGPISRPAWYIVNHADIASYASLRQRLGLPLPWGDAFVPWMKLDPMLGVPGAFAREHAADRFYCDLAETTFHDANSLEACVRRAIERPDWRSAISAWMRDHALAHLSTHAAVRSLLAMIGATLAPPAG